MIKRESFVNLVRRGQLEIVGGGWVMNDEVIFSFLSSQHRLNCRLCGIIIRNFRFIEMVMLLNIYI